MLVILARLYRQQTYVIISAITQTTTTGNAIISAIFIVSEPVAASVGGTVIPMARYQFVKLSTNRHFYSFIHNPNAELSEVQL